MAKITVSHEAREPAFLTPSGVLGGVQESGQSKTKFVNGRDSCLIESRGGGVEKPKDRQTCIMFVGKEVFESRVVFGAHFAVVYHCVTNHFKARWPTTALLLSRGMAE